MIDFVLSGHADMDRLVESDSNHYRFRAEDIVDFLGAAKAEELASACREGAHTIDGRQCKKDALAFVRCTMTSSISANNDTRIIYKKRKGSNRIEYNFVAVSLFGALTSHKKAKNRKSPPVIWWS